MAGYSSFPGAIDTLIDPSGSSPTNLGTPHHTLHDITNDALIEIETLLTTQNVAYAATITPDASKGRTIIVGTLTGNITINAPINAASPGSVALPLTFVFTQDGTGSRTITWNTVFQTTFQPNPIANKTSGLSFIYQPSSGNWLPVASHSGTLATLSVAGSSTFTGSIQANAITSSTSVTANTLSVAGATTTNGITDTGGITTTNLTLSGTINVAALSTLTISGNISTGGTLNATGAATLGSLTVPGNAFFDTGFGGTFQIGPTTRCLFVSAAANNMQFYYNSQQTANLSWGYSNGMILQGTAYQGGSSYNATLALGQSLVTGGGTVADLEATTIQIGANNTLTTNTLTIGNLIPQTYLAGSSVTIEGNTGVTLLSVASGNVTIEGPTQGPYPAIATANTIPSARVPINQSGSNVITASSSGVTITFGTAFNAAPIVVATIKNNTTPADCSVDTISTTGFKVYVDSGGSRANSGSFTIYWVAIGYV